MSLESLLEGGLRGAKRSRAARFSFPTYVTSQTPVFPRNYFSNTLRDTTAIANALLIARIGASALIKRPVPLQGLSVYEDRRRWHPDAIAPARSTREFIPQMGERLPTHDPLTPAIRRRINTEPLPAWWPRSPFQKPRVLQQARLAPIQYGFMHPRKVIICLKRKIRREIAHALGFAGSSHNKKPRFNNYSYIRC